MDRQVTFLSRSKLEIAMYCKISIAVLLVIASVSTTQAQLNNTQRGALTGGAAGAVIGGIIGNQNDETPEGALIGGAVGAIAGSILGKQEDRAQYQQQAFQQHRAQVQATRFANGVSINDVVTLSQTGVAEGLVIQQIQQYGIQQQVGVNEIVFLHQQGVNNNIIAAMQQARFAGAVPAPVVAAQPVLSGPPIGYQPAIIPIPRPIVAPPTIVVNPRPVVVTRPVVVNSRPIVVTRPPVKQKTAVVVPSKRYAPPKYAPPKYAPPKYSPSRPAQGRRGPSPNSRYRR